MTQETRSIRSDSGNASQAAPARADNRIIGRVLLIFVIFLLLRFCVQSLLVILTMTLAQTLPDAARDALIVTKEGEFLDFTGNAMVVISGISFAVCGLCIFKKALSYAGKYTVKKDESPVFAALSCLAAAFLAVSLNILIAKSGIMQMSEGYQETAEIQYSCSFLIGIVIYGIVTPLSEELLFRGIIYNGIKAFLSWKPAMILCSVLFAVYHGNGVQGIYALLMSLFFVYLYEKSGNFLVPVLMHSVSNIAAYILTYVYVPGTGGDIAMIAGAVLWGACFAVLLAWDRIKIRKK